MKKWLLVLAVALLSSCGFLVADRGSVEYYRIGTDQVVLYNTTNETISDVVFLVVGKNLLLLSGPCVKRDTGNYACYPPPIKPDTGVSAVFAGEVTSGYVRYKDSGGLTHDQDLKR